MVQYYIDLFISRLKAKLILHKYCKYKVLNLLKHLYQLLEKSYSKFSWY